MSPPGGAILWPGKSSEAFEVKGTATRCPHWEVTSLGSLALGSHTHPTPPLVPQRAAPLVAHSPRVPGDVYTSCQGNRVNMAAPNDRVLRRGSQYKSAGRDQPGKRLPFQPIAPVLPPRPGRQLQLSLRLAGPPTRPCCPRHISHPTGVLKSTVPRKDSWARVQDPPLFSLPPKLKEEKQKPKETKIEKPGLRQLC